MKWRRRKFVGLTVLVGIAVCVVAYAGKCNEVSLPEAVKAAIDALYPQATIAEAEAEEEGMKVYEVELEQNGQEVELTVAPDGTLVEVETEVAVDSLPAAVAAALAQAAEGAEVKEISQEVTYWVVILKKLDVPETTYEAELIKDGKEIEIEVAADGTILEHEVKDDDGDDDDGDDEEEEEVSIDQVPAAVKATILSQAEGGTIDEIERETEDGKIIYEAEVIINGEEVEIEVAADGTLLSREVEDDDDEHEDDDDDDDD